MQHWKFEIEHISIGQIWFISGVLWGSVEHCCRKNQHHIQPGIPELLTPWHFLWFTALKSPCCFLFWSHLFYKRGSIIHDNITVCVIWLLFQICTTYLCICDWYSVMLVLLQHTDNCPYYRADKIKVPQVVTHTHTLYCTV